jgi:hypothetical protein
MNDNSMENCAFCGSDGGAEGDWEPCACGYGRTLGCAGKPSCGDCEEAHRKIGKFIVQLLKSKVSSRSNSIRARLFYGLYSTLAALSKEQPHFYSTFRLKKISPFDHDWKFRTGVLAAVRSARLNKKFADQLYYDPNGEVTSALFEPALSAFLNALRG